MPRRGAGPSNRPGGGNPKDRITLWNTINKKKISGFVAPIRKNLIRYLAENPHLEPYSCELEMSDVRTLLHRRNSDKPPEAEEKVPLWNKFEHRLLKESDEPMKKNLEQFLRIHPEWEVYDGQYERLHALRLAKVPVWHKTEKCKLRNADSPLGKHVKAFLDKNPDWEIYYGQAGELLENGNRVDTDGNLISPLGTIALWDPVGRKILPPEEWPIQSELTKRIAGNGELEIYKGQDKIPPMPVPKSSSGTTNNSYRYVDNGMWQGGLFLDKRGRVLMWNRSKRAKVSGNASPFPSNIDSTIQRHPYLEVYRGQDTDNILQEIPAHLLGSPRPSPKRELRALDIDKFCSTNNPVSTLLTNENASSRAQVPKDVKDDIDDAFIQRQSQSGDYREKYIESASGETQPEQLVSARPSLQRELRALDIDLFCHTNKAVSTLLTDDNTSLQAQEPKDGNDDMNDDRGSIINQFLND